MIDVNDNRIPAAIRERAKNQIVAPRIDNTAALAASTASIVHINTGVSRPITVAYERINKSHIKIATAVTHRHDTFTRKVGTKVALANFAAGKVIVLPLPSKAERGDVPHIIRAMFGYIA